MKKSISAGLPVIRNIVVIILVTLPASPDLLNNILIQKDQKAYIRGGGQLGYSTPGSYIDGNIYWRGGETTDFVCGGQDLEACCLDADLKNTSNQVPLLSLMYKNLDDTSSGRIYFNAKKQPIDPNSRWHRLSYKSFRDFKCLGLEKTMYDML